MDLYMQTLRFVEAKGTLENLAGEKPHRCISLWAPRGDEPRFIFAMRLKNEASVLPVLPWEDGTDNGTWGAEDEPPLRVSL